ncbi:tRNA1(Val) (adenine(37)-N6)-methyltransferase [Shewanella baltica]|uniref:tRNA1(Val) (adenine(37)-N6)-methyltransferase n=1 Tax=Shewanella baltica TaxID=62322 RepID=UPI003D79223F
MAFTFKQFHIDDMNCGMAVGTDSVVLGAWAQLTAAKTVLDIGAGSGLLSLMAAQRSQAHITSVELDTSAAEACQHNFHNSPWANRLTLVNSSIQDFCQQIEYQEYFDHIICNPPYFEQGTQAIQSQRAMARHTDSLSFTALLDAIHVCLAPQGNASLILPMQSMARLNEILAHSQLSLIEITNLISIVGKSANRVLCVLAHKTHPQIAPKISDITIRELSGQYTQTMVQLIRDFYLKY